MKKIHLILMSTSVLLTACTGTSQNYYAPAYSTAHYETNGNYYHDYNKGFNYTQYEEPQTGREVSIPDSYHVSSYHGPETAKNRDKQWVNSQHSQNYTIEISQDEKASAVANKLSQVPKSDRTAEIKYQNNGKTYYKGLYGSYPSKEEAQKALDALPASIKQGAGIHSFGDVKNNMDE